MTSTRKGDQQRARILAALRTHEYRSPYQSVTVRELAQQIGLAYSGVYRHLVLLQVAGRVTMQPGKARTLRLTRKEEP